MQASTKMVMTPEEYLEQERKAPFKSEYYAGEVFAMAGASPRQYLDRGQYRLPLRGPSSRARAMLRPPQRFACEGHAATGLYTYPDVVVVCGTPRYEDRQKDTLLNPNSPRRGSFQLHRGL